MSWQADDRARVARILHGFAPEPAGDGWLGIYGPNEIPVNRRGELPGPSGRLDHPTILITRRLLYDPDGFEGVFGGVPFRRGHLVVAVQVEPAVAELLAARVAGQLGAHLDAAEDPVLDFVGSETHPTEEAGRTEGGLWAEVWRVPFCGEGG